MSIKNARLIQFSSLSLAHYHCKLFLSPQYLVDKSKICLIILLRLTEVCSAVQEVRQQKCGFIYCFTSLSRDLRQRLPCGNDLCSIFYGVLERHCDKPMSCFF